MTRLPRTYFVCATPRSGSTLLCKSLAATGVAGRPEEFFERLRHSGLPREPREYFDGGADPAVLDLLPPTRTGDPARADLQRELARYLQEGSTPNGVVGAKLMWGYFGDLLARLGSSPHADDALDRLHAAFGPARWIHVTRDDKVAQAVSLWRALQTRAWSASDDPEAHPVYDARGIAHLRDQLVEHDAAWSAWLAARAVAPHVVEYESFAAEHTATLGGVLAHLGLEVEHIPDPPLDRQGDARSDRWVARFNEEKELV